MPTTHTYSPTLTPHSIGIIVGRDLVGDALIKLPFLRALRNGFPKARIHWITAQGPTAYGSTLREATRGLIDEIHEQPIWLEVRGLGLGAGEKKSHILTPSSQPPAPSFDLIIDTRNRWREALLARKIPHAIFISPALRFLFSDRRPPLFESKPPHLVDQLLRMVEVAAGHRPLSTGALLVPEKLQKIARSLLPEGKTYVGIAPGSGNAIKIWPRYKFEKIAQMQASKGRTPVFILGPQELDWFDELTNTVPGALFPLQDYKAWGTAQLTIDHTLAVAGCLSVAVANDSGVGNMLAAMDCPLVSLFGPTSPEKLAPRVSRGIIIRAQDFGGSSMKKIRWEEVDAAIDRLVG